MTEERKAPLEALDIVEKTLKGAPAPAFEHWRPYLYTIRAALTPSPKTCGAVGKEACLTRDRIAEDCGCNAVSSPRDEDVQNLTMLVKRLCHAIRNSTNDDSPARDIVADALGYLSRKGLSGTPLRKEYTEESVSPYKDYTWEDVAMLVQENRALKEAATAQRCEWLDISDCPLGANDIKTSHVILVNKYGNICRGYRIHDGTGKYKIHDPFYNEHGQTFHPIGWMPLPAAPVEKSAEKHPTKGETP